MTQLLNHEIRELTFYGRMSVGNPPSAKTWLVWSKLTMQCRADWMYNETFRL